MASARGLVKVRQTVGLHPDVRDLLDKLVDKPQLDSLLLENVVLTSGVTNLVPHTLGRRFRGWTVADMITAGATVRRDTTSTADSALFIPLIVSGTCTVSLVVF